MVLVEPLKEELDILGFEDHAEIAQTACKFRRNNPAACEQIKHTEPIHQVKIWLDS